MALSEAQSPRNVVAELNGQRQTMLACLAVRMDAADVALLVDPEISVGRHQLAPGDLGSARRKSPQEGGHRRVFQAADLDGRLGQQAVASDEVARSHQVELGLKAAAKHRK